MERTNCLTWPSRTPVLSPTHLLRLVNFTYVFLDFFSSLLYTLLMFFFLFVYGNLYACVYLYYDVCIYLFLRRVGELKCMYVVVFPPCVCVVCLK